MIRRPLCYNQWWSPKTTWYSLLIPKVQPASAGRKNNHDTTRVVYLRHLYFSILTLDAQIEVSHKTKMIIGKADRAEISHHETNQIIALVVAPCCIIGVIIGPEYHIVCRSYIEGRRITLIRSKTAESRIWPYGNQCCVVDGGRGLRCVQQQVLAHHTALS